LGDSVLGGSVFTELRWGFLLAVAPVYYFLNTDGAGCENDNWIKLPQNNEYSQTVMTTSSVLVKTNFEEIDPILCA